MSLINAKEINLNENIEEQVLSQLQQFNVAFDNNADVAAYFKELDDEFDGSFTTNECEKHILYAESAKDMDVVITIFENYIDSGSVDYVYTFAVEYR